MHPAPTGAPAPALPRDDDERGSMLIVALGILALLSVLALTFVKLMNLERQATANYVDGVRSRMIAEGGLERALAQLKLTLSASAFSDPSASWVYAAGDPSLPLEEASSDPNADPRIKASFAGRLGVSYGAGLAAKADEDPWGDSYRIKVLDTQTQFNLNSHFDLKAASTSAPGTGDSFDTDPGYVRFLDALGQAIAELNPRANRRNPILHARYPRATGTSARNAARGGEAILRFRQSREGQQFRSKAELLEILDNEEDFLLLKDYITCYSWRDPKTVVAASTGDEGDVLNFRKKSWNQVKQANSKERRSPVNINLASTEVLTATLAGIAGRARYIWPHQVHRKTVEEGTKFQDPDADNQEEDEYELAAVVVYFTPFGILPAPNTLTGPDVSGARILAEEIRREREIRPFTSYADWEAFVDRKVTTAFLSQQSNGVNVFPRPDPLQMRDLDLDQNPATTAPYGALVNDRGFQQWYDACVRSMLKANFNPNPRISGFNPDDTTFLPVDKGGLLYHDLRLPDAGPLVRHQTLEWCFAPKGVFEVTSLGEIQGPPSEDVSKRVDKDGNGKIDPEMFAQAKVRGIVQLYDTESLRTQRDFVRLGSPGEYGPDRIGVASTPVPKVYWDPTIPGLNVNVDDYYRTFEDGGGLVRPSDTAGYLQLEPKAAKSAMGATASTQVVDMHQFGDPRFELLFQDARDEQAGNTSRESVRQADPLQADVSNGTRHGEPGKPHGERVANSLGWPYGSARDGVWDRNTGAFARIDNENRWRQLVLTTDGYLNTDLRPSTLWYRAADGEFPGSWPPALGGGASTNNDPDATRQGKSLINDADQRMGAADGNVAPTNLGGAEFWWKPEFDWMSAPNQANETFCGLMSLSHVLPNEASPNQPLTRGTQMYVTRNTNGELRITRLYYEVTGDDATPVVTGAGGQISFMDYLDAFQKQDVATLDLGWPPRELRVQVPPPFLAIQFARTDWFVRRPHFEDWKAREWHHIAMRWNDAASTAIPTRNAPAPDKNRPGMEVWVDGQFIGNQNFEARQIGPRYEPFRFPPASTNPPTPGQVEKPPTSWGADWPPPYPSWGASDNKLPQFVRVNTLLPKDQVTVGSVNRDQALLNAGLFKHKENVELHANGTIDDFRLYDGRLGGVGNPKFERFEGDGLWRGEVDLGPYFPTGSDQLTLGALQFVAYLPTRYGAITDPRGMGAVTVTLEVEKTDGTIISHPHWTATVSSNLPSPTSKSAFPLTTPLGTPVTVHRTDKVIYEVSIVAGRPGSTGAALVSPALDEISVTYFLPSAKTLLKERVNN